MESTNFINPQALSSALAVLIRYSLRPSIYKIHRLLDVRMRMPIMQRG